MIKDEVIFKEAPFMILGTFVVNGSPSVISFYFKGFEKKDYEDTFDDYCFKLITCDNNIAKGSYHFVFKASHLLMFCNDPYIKSIDDEKCFSLEFFYELKESGDANEVQDHL